MTDKEKRKAEDILDEILSRDEEISNEEIEDADEKDEKVDSEESNRRDVVKEGESVDELTDITNKYLRLAAEFDNYKKRQEKEYERLVDYKMASFYREFIPIFENIKRAYEIETKSDEAKQICDGFCLIYNTIHKLLQKAGVHKIGVEVGDEFDSEIMEALCVLSTDEYEPNVVLEVNENGYMYGDRLLKPARVSVSCEPGLNEGEDVDDEEDDDE